LAGKEHQGKHPEPGRLFGKWCIRDDIGKVGGCVSLDISNAEIPNDVIKGGLRLPTSDVAKALFKSVFKCREATSSMTLIPDFGTDVRSPNLHQWLKRPAADG
jgi:hypothetical protein